MRSSYLVVVLLVLAALSVDSAALSIVNIERTAYLRWPDLRIAVLVSLTFSQVSLAAIWAALGRFPLPGRLTMLVAAVTLWSIAMEHCLIGFPQNQALVLLSAQSLLVAAPLVGYRILRQRARGTRRDSKRSRRRLQFSLAYLLAWMTATAAMLGLIRYSVGERLFYFGLGHRACVETAVLATSNTMLALAMFWAVHGRRATPLRAAAALLMIIAILSLYRTLVGSDPHLAALALFTLLEVLWLLVMLGVLRAAGFRLAGVGQREEGREEG